jgi:hypothetical protein
MFEQTSGLAERLAVSVSRRGFLGSLGGWATAAALGVAGILAGTATAGPPEKCKNHVCIYTCACLVGADSCGRNPCPPTYLGCPLQYCARGAPPLCDCSSW